MMKRERLSVCGRRKSDEGAVTDLTSKIFRPKVIRSIEETIDKHLSKYKKLIHLNPAKFTRKREKKHSPYKLLG